MFESHDLNSEPRSNSPNPSTNGERRTSRIRSSFASVEETNGAIQIHPYKTQEEHQGRSSTPKFSREEFSFDEGDKREEIDTLKKGVTQERDARKKSLIVSETVPETAIEATPSAGTPATEAKDHTAAGDLTADQELTDCSDVQEVGTASKASGLASKEPSTDSTITPPQDKANPAAEEEPEKMHAKDPETAAAVGEDFQLPAPSTTNGEATPAPKQNGVAAQSNTRRVSMKTPARVTSAAELATSASASSKRAAPATTNRSANKLPHPRISQTPKGTPAINHTKTPVSALRQPSFGAAGSPGIQSMRTPSGKSNRRSLEASTASSAAKAKPHVPASSPVQSTNPTRYDVSTISGSLAMSANGTANILVSSKHSPASKPQVRSPTQPIRISSNLTAPTASSAAKRDSINRPAPQAAPAAPASSTTRKPAAIKPARSSTSTAKPAPSTNGTSLARANSTATKRPAGQTTTSRPAASKESFLARMTRPTASSASKTHEKAEVKSSPQRAASVIKPRTNGHAKPRAAKGETGEALQASKVNGIAKLSTPDAREPEAVDESSAATPAFDSATIR